MNPNGIPSEVHFHIRWLLLGELDWERHETRAQAEESAKKLSQRNEQYRIEQFDESCPKCRTLAHPTMS